LAIDGVIRQVVETAKGGIFVPPGNADLLAGAITDLADDPQRAREMGSNAHTYVVEHFNRDEHARDFAALISRVALRRA
jgi:glycosyltransferase involved in cell wall biosynthesis